LSTPFVTLSPVFTNGECGSDGFAFDPNFSENGFIYIFVVESSTVSKVLRYTATGDVGGSKTTILNNLPTNGQFHNGGAMGFGKDGKLYVAIGDNNIGRGVDGDLSSAASKILRANKNGSVPTDNPFIDGSGGNNDYVWARGFRNPFSLCFRPISHQLWLSVVGEAKEQLFLVTERKHGGWNDFEGNQPTTGDFIRPKLQYDSHGSWAGGGVGCITGGCFYDSTQFPSSHRGNYFFTDYTSDVVMRSVMSGDSVGAPTRFVTGLDQAVDMVTGPDGALYYARHSAGQVLRLRHTGSSQEIVVWPTYVSMEENGTASFMVSLKVAPSSNVTVNVAHASGSTDVDNNLSTLTFTTSNWSTPQKVTLTAAGDSDTSNDTATFSVASSGLTTHTVTVNVIDTGSASVGNIVLSKTTMTIPEGSDDTYTVQLSQAPAGNVTVTSARSSGDSSVSVTSGGSLTFTTSNWNSPQTVTVTATNDADLTDDTAVITASAPGYSSVNVSVSAPDTTTQAPVITSTAVTTATENAPYSYDVEASGVPTPTYSLVAAPSGMTINSSSGVISWTPSSSQIGSNAVTVRASNSAGNGDQSFNVDVGPDDAPTADLSAPEEGETVGGSNAEFYGNGIDDVGTVAMEFYVDGVLEYTDNQLTGNHFHFNSAHNSWDTTVYSDGAHTVSVRVRDTAGQWSPLVTRNIVVDNTVPAVITREAETSSPVPTGATIRVENDSLASGGQWISLLADGVGDYIEYSLPSVPAGTYSVTMRYKIHPNRGILQMSIGGSNVGSPLDQYSATPQYVESTFGTATLSGGTAVIRLTVTGKNAAAGLYTLSADSFTLTPVSGAIANEAESLAVEASSGDTVRTLTEAAASGGVSLMNDTNAVDDFLTLRIPNISAGTYSVKVRFKVHPSRGIVQVQIGKIGGSLGNLGAPVDLYSATSGYQEFTLGTWTPGSTSDKQISFKITGKNAASSGFTQNIDLITLTPQ
jgi:glucose/arabinose dehydrogenase